MTGGISLPARAGRLAAVALMAWALAGCSSLSLLNPFSSRGPQPAPLPPIEQAEALLLRWEARVSAAPQAFLSPAVTAEEIVVAGGNGEVVALDRQGAVRWRSDLAAPIAAGVGTDGRVAAVVTERGEVVALSMSDGSVRWRQSVSLPALTPPLVSDGVVVVRATDHRLVAFDVLDGKERWRYHRPLPPLSLRQSAPLVSAQGVVFAGFPGGTVTALQARSGSPLFELTVATPRGSSEIERLTDVVGPVVLWRDELCAAAFQGRIACFDLRSGRELLQKPFSSPVGVDRDVRTLVTVAENDDVLAFDVFSGEVRWQNEALRHRGLTRPVMVRGTVLVGDREGYVHALDSSNGRVLARQRVGSAALRTLVAADGGHVLVQNADGTLARLEVRW